MILDSSFLIDGEHEEAVALAKAREIEASGLPRRVPPVVVSERYIGVGNGIQSTENRRRVDGVLRSLPIVEATVPIARRAGTIEGELQASEESDEGIGIADAFVAATAIEYDEPVVPGDPDDFARVDGVEIETY